MNELLNDFQEFRRILCVCPCCGDIVRVSDLRLKVKGTAHTWLDDHEKKEQQIEKKEEKFSEEEEKLREIARAKGRKAAQKVFENAVFPAIRKLRIDPFDLKPILNPVDFVAFKGMNCGEEISEIMFLSKECSSPSLESARVQIARAVSSRKYCWQVARIDEDGGIEFE